MDLNEQFQAAADKVDNLPPNIAAGHMTELYGLFKQATDGDVNMKPDEVDPNAADQANGPAGLSQAQWESWNQFKGLPEEDAKQRYVARVAEITGGDAGAPTNTVATENATNAPAGDNADATDNTTLARQPNQGPGQSTEGGLQGDITLGAPYGGVDMLKGQQSQ
jgi:acyl-CoA-binding protein